MEKNWCEISQFVAFKARLSSELREVDQGHLDFKNRPEGSMGSSKAGVSLGSRAGERVALAAVSVIQLVGRSLRIMAEPPASVT